jgi:hypothetical protein
MYVFVEDIFPHTHTPTHGTGITDRKNKDLNWPCGVVKTVTTFIKIRQMGKKINRETNTRINNPIFAHKIRKID